MAEKDHTLLRKPIIIVGAPRSGTTMMMHIFNKHPRLAMFREPRLTWRYGNDGKSDMLQPKDARPEVCRHVRQTFAASIREQGKERFVEKTPANALRLGFVDRIFPDCKFLHTLRHGQDSILSYRDFWVNRTHGVRRDKLRQRLRELKLRQAPYYAKELVRRMLPKRITGPNLWGPRIPGIQSMVGELDVLDICCLQWRMCVEAACHYGRSLPRDRYMEFRLEDMNLELFDSIIEFCELDDCSTMRTHFREVYDPDTPLRRRGQADPEELERIRRWIEPTQQWLGYC